MKLNIVLASVCFIGTYGCITAMDHKKDAYLKFKLDKELHVVDSKAKHMQFFLSPADFTGKVITEAVPLSPEDKIAVTSACQNAFVIRKTKQKVEYTLGEKRFIAAIKYKKDSFSVKVRESAPVEKK